jgi:predicted DNA-binding protein with PD1-like motif
MIYQESRVSKQLVAHIEPGESIVEELTQFCRDNDIRAAEIRAVGSLSQVELANFDSEAGEYVPTFEAEGTFELLHLNGNVSVVGDEVVVRLDVVVGSQGPFGEQIRAGQLREGISQTCEVFIDVFDDLEVERQIDRQTGRMPIAKIRRTKSVPTDESDGTSEESETHFEGKGLSWEDAAKESKEQKQRTKQGSTNSTDEPGDHFDEPLIESGDILNHPKLGRCHVMKVEDDKYLHIRLPKGKIRKLSRAIVDIEFVEEQNGTNIFEANV